jgi:hypothetical protein
VSIVVYLSLPIVEWVLVFCFVQLTLANSDEFGGIQISEVKGSPKRLGTQRNGIFNDINSADENK